MDQSKNFNYSEVVCMNRNQPAPLLRAEVEKWKAMREVVEFDTIKGFTNYGTDDTTILLFLLKGKHVFTLTGKYDELEQALLVEFSSNTYCNKFRYHPFAAETFAAAYHEHTAPPAPRFNNYLFAAHIDCGRFLHHESFYTIDESQDSTGHFWELVITRKNADKAKYQYPNKSTAEEDIAQANTLANHSFEDI